MDTPCRRGPRRRILRRIDTKARAAWWRRQGRPPPAAQETLTLAAAGRLLAAIEEQRWRDEFVGAFTRSR
jgi:hypothetical protein